jgi:hypothetical protein
MVVMMMVVAEPAVVVVVIERPEEPVMVMVVMMVVVLHRLDLGGIGAGLFSQNSIAGLEKRNRIGDRLQQIVIAFCLHGIMEPRRRLRMGSAKTSERRGRSN